MTYYLFHISWSNVLLKIYLICWWIFTETCKQDNIKYFYNNITLYIQGTYRNHNKWWYILLKWINLFVFTRQKLAEPTRCDLLTIVCSMLNRFCCAILFALPEKLLSKRKLMSTKSLMAIIILVTNHVIFII